MAIWIVKNSGKTSYGIKRYLCDTEEDLPYSENGEAVAPGSKAYVISEKETFMMGSDGDWYQIEDGPGASSISELTDVDLTGLDDGKILKYDETEGVWKPANDVSATSIGNLEDVDLTGLEDGQMLKYDEATQKWIASDAPVDIVELTQEQYDELPSATKDLPLIYQISDKGYFFYRSKKFRASKELTQDEYDQLSPEEQNNGTEYLITDAPGVVAELTQAQYDVLTPEEKNNGTIWQISNRGYFYYKGKQFRVSREITQAEYDALSTSEKSNGTEYLITDATTSISDIDDISISGATDGQSLYYDATLGVWKNSAGKIVYAEINGTLTAGQDTIVLSSNYITTDSVVDPFVGNAFDGVTYTSMTIANGSVTLVFPVQASDMPVMVRVWIDGYGAANNIEIDDDHALPDQVWSGEKIQEEITNIYSQLAELYDNTATYNVGDTVIYNNNYYENITQIVVPEDFDPTKWEQIDFETRLAEKIDNNEFADDYSEIETYQEGDVVVYDNKFYINTTPISAPGEAWNPDHWQPVVLSDLIPTVEDKMDKVNPVGSGKILFNAASGSTGGTRSVCLSYNGDASGDYSTCLGRGCTAGGNYSIAAGYNNTSTAGSSVVMGARNTSEYSYSTAIGSDLTVGKNYQTVLGRYNEVDASSAVVVGYGSSETAANIFTLSTGGKGTFSGAVEATGLGATLKQAVIDAIYPVGSIYMTVSDDTAAKVKARFGGTWVAWGAGRVPVGMGNNGTTNYTTVEATGGADSVTLTGAQSGLQAHTHTMADSLANPSGLHTHGDRVIKTTNEGDGYGLPKVAGFQDRVLVYSNNESKPWVNNGISVDPNSGRHTHTINQASAKNATAAHENRQSYITCYMWKRTA